MKIMIKGWRYTAVGFSSAIVFASVQLLLGLIFPLWISNVCGFLAGSIISYFGHALYTFRDETAGSIFARRWLLIQFITNLIICAVLPFLLKPIGEGLLTRLILIFTPSVLNLLIWSRAATFSHKRVINKKSFPIIHADDLGLTTGINNAIFELYSIGKLDSASLIVNGKCVLDAIKQWEKNSHFPLCLHLCLSEGRAISPKEKVKTLINKDGLLKQTFFKLFLSSFLPKSNNYRKRLEQDLYCEIKAQVKLFKDLTKLDQVSLDGHQHIHLVPIVLQVIIKVAKESNINWIRTTKEAIPIGLKLRQWKVIFNQNRWLKWLILQILSLVSQSAIRNAALKTNHKFAGVLFTGRMVGYSLLKSIDELESCASSTIYNKPILLAHPSTNASEETSLVELLDFPLSTKFVTSYWRKKEFNELKSLYEK
ncbi:ChbG/HpnK family deacetylase [Prochlorococcus sp. MIT 1307]|uniref:ChbG/HpnK family deacetylase n=1 Tax=Prochlorococcus sp. MIT 1307 TaxID=3096219 RepID=UPI002A7666C4|nr:ChbG/HpnK family deacetylase [Prochlorococcus sp. MIT 1307]